MTERAPLSPSALPASALTDLKTRHLAFFEARLTSPAAEAEWPAAVEGLYRDLLATRVSALADPEAIAALVESAIAQGLVENAARPLARRALALGLAEVNGEKSTVGAHVPTAAWEKLDRLAARPDVLPERLLRELVEQEAVDEMMRDVLYAALKEFSEKVNPFVAEWGLPSLLKKLGPFGLGKSFDTMRADFDKRLEPEIRKFLKGFTKKSLRHAVQVTIDQAAQPKSIAVRKHLVAWVLAQEIGALLKATDPEILALGQEIALDVLGAELGREASRARWRAMLEEAVATRKDHTVAEVLGELGVVITLDFKAIAAASWPLVKAALGSPTAKVWFAAMIGEFYDQEIAASGG